MRRKDPEKKIAIKAFVENYAFEHQGKTPTVVEISKGISLSSSSVHRYLKEMDKDGTISYIGGRISSDIIDKINMDFTCIGITHEEDSSCIDEYVLISRCLLNESKNESNANLYIVKVTDNSINGLSPGDMVFIQQKSHMQHANAGNIVHVIINGTSTLKRVGIIDNHTVLMSDDNPSTVISEGFCILGVAINVLKNLLSQET